MDNVTRSIKQSQPQIPNHRQRATKREGKTKPIKRETLPPRKIGVLCPIQSEECGAGYYDKNVKTGRWSE